MTLEEKSNDELISLFNERIMHNYLMIKPDLHFEYPNSYEGDCLKIAHVLTQRLAKEKQKSNKSRCL